MVSGWSAMLASGWAVPQWADSIRMASGRGSWADSVPNSADGIDGSIGNVGAPWDRKSDGIRVMAAKSAASAARKLGCYQYKAALSFDKRLNSDLIASC